MTNHPLKCRCGRLQGVLEDTERVNRVVCYCRDCQAFAHYLGRPDEILDENGGSDVIQALPANLRFTSGMDQLACLRLTEKGLLRWYAACCNTPVGNTVADFRFSFIGLLHCCLDQGGVPLDTAFGPVRMWNATPQAWRPVNPSKIAWIAGVLRFVKMVARARFDGSFKRTPLFSPETGAPIVVPKVLSAAERERLRLATGSLRAP
jgi:hypothetical protein